MGAFAHQPVAIHAPVLNYVSGTLPSRAVAASISECSASISALSCASSRAAAAASAAGSASAAAAASASAFASSFASGVASGVASAPGSRAGIADAGLTYEARGSGGAVGGAEPSQLKR